MNSAVVLCFLVVLGVLQTIDADPLLQLRLQLQRAKSTIDSSTNDLKRTKNNLDYSTKSRINAKKLEGMQNINSFVNPALTQIRAHVDAAAVHGKHAEPCFTDAKASLRTISLDGFSGLDKCQSDAQGVLQQALSNLQTLETTGSQLKAELDSIFPSCYSSNIMQMSSCIAIKLGTSNASIRSYENQVSSAKTEATSTTNNAFLSMSSCGFDVTSSVRSKVTDVKITASSCIQNA